MLKVLVLSRKTVGTNEPGQLLQAFKRGPSVETLAALISVTTESAEELVGTGSTIVNGIEYILQPEFML